MNKQLKPFQEFQNAWLFQTDPVNPWAYWEKAFTLEECQKIIEYAEQYEKTIGKTNATNEENNKYRDSEVVWISPSEEINWVFRRLTDVITKLNEDYFKFDLMGFTEALQFTEYTAPTGSYGKHVDSMYDHFIRKLSLSVQLSDPKDYEGGELQLHLDPHPTVMKKEQGTILCFPSYVLHEVKPVTKGKRYSLVGWVTGKPFK
jgi:PKHD-type hydroxylase